MISTERFETAEGQLVCISVGVAWCCATVTHVCEDYIEVANVWLFDRQGECVGHRDFTPVSPYKPQLLHQHVLLEDLVRTRLRGEYAPNETGIATFGQICRPLGSVVTHND